MTDIARLRDTEGRVHWAARDSKTAVDGLAEGRFVDIDAPSVPEPPRSGSKSGVDAWRSYAISQGVAVSDDMSRGDIVAAVDALKEVPGEASTGQPGDDLHSGTTDGGSGVGERKVGIDN